MFFKLHFQFIQSDFSWNRVYFWNQIVFYSISAQQITLMPKWNHSIFFFFYTEQALIWPALSELCSIHSHLHISSLFIEEGYFKSSHNVKLELLEAAHWLYRPSESARNALWGKKMPSRDIIEHLMGALGSYVGGAITEKDCSALSTLLEAYIVNCMYSLHIALLP